MDYKAVLVHVDMEPAAEARIRLAIGLAQASGSSTHG